MTIPAPGAIANAEREVLRAGLKSTPARVGVLTILTSHDHLSPEKIHFLLEREQSGLSLSTIYRTLDTLVETGLVGYSRLTEGVRSYHLARHQGHIHLTCRECGNDFVVSQSIMTRLADELAATYGFCMDVDHLVVTGRCITCVQESASA